MAHATICDMCEAIGRGEGSRPPAGWVTVRVETILDVGNEHRSLHACSGGCAVRALAQYVHERDQLVDERDRCEVAGCERPAEPATLRCAAHAHSTATIPQCEAVNVPPFAMDDEHVKRERCELEVGHAGPHRVDVGLITEWRWHDEQRATADWTGG